MTTARSTVFYICAALFIGGISAMSFPAQVLAQSYGGQQGVGVNYETRLSAIEQQLRILTGKAEQNDYLLQKTRSDLQRIQADYDDRLQHLERDLQAAQTAAPQHTQNSSSNINKAARTETASPEPEEPEDAFPSPLPPPNNAASVKGTLGSLEVQNGRITGGSVQPKSPPLPETPKDYSLNPKEQYDRAFSLLRQANYEEAEEAFKSFIDKNPKDKLIDNAKYWYGETFYARSQFNDAAIAFADAYQTNSRGAKAADSLLKLALSLGKLDKVQDACATLSSMKAKFPNTSQSLRSRADQEMSRLKCK